MGRSLNKSYYFFTAGKQRSLYTTEQDLIRQVTILLGIYFGISYSAIASFIIFEATSCCYGVAVLIAYSARTLLSNHLLVSTQDTLQSRL